MASSLWDRSLRLLVALGIAVAGSTARADSLHDAAFVAQLYRDLLDRTASGSEIDAGVLMLENESRLEFASALLAGPEYRQDVVGDLYDGYLLRAPTSIERTAGVNALGSGTDEGLAAAILGSAEYFASRGASDDSGFLVAAYGDVLSRSPTSGEDAFWLSALGSGTTRQDVAASLLGSLEYDDDLVTSFFQRFLRRAPSSPELQDSAAQLNGGAASDEQVIAELVGSDEYYALAPEPARILGAAAALAALLTVRRAAPCRRTRHEPRAAR